MTNGSSFTITSCNKNWLRIVQILTSRSIDRLIDSVTILVNTCDVISVTLVSWSNLGTLDITTEPLLSLCGRAGHHSVCQFFASASGLAYIAIAEMTRLSTFQKISILVTFIEHGFSSTVPPRIVPNTLESIIGHSAKFWMLRVKQSRPAQFIHNIGVVGQIVHANSLFAKFVNNILKTFVVCFAFWCFGIRKIPSSCAGTFSSILIYVSAKTLDHIKHIIAAFTVAMFIPCLQTTFRQSNSTIYCRKGCATGCRSGKSGNSNVTCRFRSAPSFAVIPFVHFQIAVFAGIAHATTLCKSRVDTRRNPAECFAYTAGGMRHNHHVADIAHQAACCFCDSCSKLGHNTIKGNGAFHESICDQHARQCTNKVILIGKCAESGLK